MDWHTFLKETLEGGFSHHEFLEDHREFRYDDDNYRRWLAHVVDALGRRRRAYELHEEERQWAERAVADGALGWAPDDFALVPLGEWPPSLEARPPRSIEQTWLDAVLKFLLEGPGRVYRLAPAERGLAARAVDERRLEWAVHGESVQLPGNTRGPTGGPYR